METNTIVNQKTTKMFQKKENIDNYNNKKKEKGDTINKHVDTKTVNKLANDKSNEMRRAQMMSKVTSEDFQKLCDQLRAFNARIQTVRELTELRYDLPRALRELLEQEASELACLYTELQAAARDVETTRLQRTAVAAERLGVGDQLARLKADGMAELEVIVSVYDSPMMERWLTVKSGSSIAAVDNFLHDVKGKLEAMKNLQILGSQKLAELQDEGKKDFKVPKPAKKKKNKELSGRGRGRGRRYSPPTTQSQTSLPFLLDTDSEEVLDEKEVGEVLYSLVSDRLFTLPDWTTDDTAVDVD